MTKQLNQSFNFAADKVVKYSEWRQNLKAAYKTNLSTNEKIFLNLVDRPMSAVFGLTNGIKGALTGNKTKGAYISTEPLAAYVSGAYVESTVKSYEKHALGKAFQSKINGLAAKAFEDCEDYSKTPVMQHLKPL